MQRVVAHEIYEAATDPGMGTGWTDFIGWSNNKLENEIGDLCGGGSSTIGGRVVSRPFSQLACACLSSPADQLQLATLRFDTKQMMHSVRLPNGFWSPC